MGDSLQEVGEDLLDSLGAVAANLPRICALDAGGPPILDVRLHKALTYFLEIRTHYGAPLWVGFDRDVEGVDLDAWDEPGDLPCAVWLPGEAPDHSYRRRISVMPRGTLTISHVEGPTGLWVALKLPAVKRSKYPFRCKDHECHGLATLKPVSIHLHRTPAIRPEIQQAISVLLQEIFLPAFEGSYATFFSNEALDHHEATLPLLPATVLQPITTPGVHFDRVPHLATIEGIVVGTDAGTRRPRDRAEARCVEYIGDEGPGMSANGTQSNPGGHHHLVGHSRPGHDPGR